MRNKDFYLHLSKEINIKSWKIMKIQLKSNDALRVLADAVLVSQKTLEKRIITSLLEEGLSIDEFENIDVSVLTFMESLGYTLEETMEVIFPKEKNKEEISTLLSHILFWGDALEKPCEDCGSEMTVQHNEHGNYKWNDYECENPNCDNTITNEPNWDSMKGGKDYGK